MVGRTTQRSSTKMIIETCNHPIGLLPVLWDHILLSGTRMQMVRRWSMTCPLKQFSTLVHIVTMILQFKKNQVFLTTMLIFSMTKKVHASFKIEEAQIRQKSMESKLFLVFHIMYQLIPNYFLDNLFMPNWSGRKQQLSQTRQICRNHRKIRTVAAHKIQPHQQDLQCQIGKMQNVLQMQWNLSVGMLTRLTEHWRFHLHFDKGSPCKQQQQQQQKDETSK